ncbi:Hypothetical predicted protein [Drosophila guanche]|uniref:Uncharacterized protein n=1 Tax=Drosophila guanche TaxID=7266 RepID=A0A3B0KJ42_DROGU|nr:Hypothetical predicted protein [Drosophila guanche]
MIDIVSTVEESIIIIIIERHSVESISILVRQCVEESSSSIDSLWVLSSSYDSLCSRSSSSYDSQWTRSSSYNSRQRNCLQATAQHLLAPKRDREAALLTLHV